MHEADVLMPPLAPPAACRRCLRPLELDKRGFGTCYPCGHEHGPVLRRIAAVTYGATGTRPWNFFTTTKFETASREHLKTFVNGIAAMISTTIEREQPAFVDGDDNHVVVPVPSSSGLIDRCLAAVEAKAWPAPVVVEALTAADRPRQTELAMDARRQAAAGKYTASDDVASQHVLLLDDAYTSGYTLHDAARAVDAAGALSVAGVVYIRRIYPDAMAVYRAELGENDDGES
jgi:predicted amidophosphoribosyltransferase